MRTGAMSTCSGGRGAVWHDTLFSDQMGEKDEWIGAR